MRKILFSMLFLFLGFQLSEAQSVVLNPSGNQTVNQPVVSGVQTSLSSNSLNGVLNATLFPGGDIGAKVNAAIAVYPCGTILIPAGFYSQTTPITKPRCTNLVGQGSTPSSPSANLGTILACNGCTSIVIADINTANTVQPGTIRDLSISGNGSGVGIYIGGVPNGTTSGYFADHQIIENVDVANFAYGYQFGNNAYATTVIGGTIHNSTSAGIYYPSGLNNSGEDISIMGTAIYNGTIGIQSDGGGELHLHSVAIDYNTVAIAGGSVNIDCFGCHIEQGGYPLVSATGILILKTYGGSFLAGKTAGAVSAFVYNTGSSSTVQMSQPSLYSAGGALNYCVQAATNGYAHINMDQPLDSGGNGCTTNTNISSSTFGVTISDPINAQYISYGVPLNLQRNLNVSGAIVSTGGINVGGSWGQSFTTTLPNCTIVFQNGVAISHSGSSCP